MSSDLLPRPPLRGIAGLFSLRACSIHFCSPFCLTCFPPYSLCLVICLFQFDRDLNKATPPSHWTRYTHQRLASEEQTENVVSRLTIFAAQVFLIVIYRYHRKRGLSAELLKPCIVSAWEPPTLEVYPWISNDVYNVSSMRRPQLNLLLWIFEVQEHHYPCVEAILFLKLLCLRPEFGGNELNPHIPLGEKHETQVLLNSVPQLQTPPSRRLRTETGFFVFQCCLCSNRRSCSLWYFSCFFRPYFDPHCCWYLPFLNYIWNWGNGCLKTLSCLLIAFSCFWGINHFHFRGRGSCFQ